MARHLIGSMEDAIVTNAPLIKEYIEKGEAFLGVHPKSRIVSLRSKLTYLKRYAYHQLAIGADPYGVAGRVHLLLRPVEIDYELALAYPPNLALARTGKREEMFNVYWRPDRIMAARAEAGLPVFQLSAGEQDALEEARKWLPKNL